MGYINFDLTNCGALNTLASPAPGVAGQLPAGMPNTGGLYLIHNQTHNNRYIGKAGDLTNRFDGRMLTVNEFGLAPGDLAGIYAFWGEVDVYSTVQPVPMVAPQLAPHATTPLINGFRVARSAFGAAPPVPNQFVGRPSPAPNYGAHHVMATIDGVQINVEALLIRLFRQMGVGGTITNLQYIGQFQNPTAHELIVQVEWGACGTVPAAHFCITVPALGWF